jgi:hypothetical protein
MAGARVVALCTLSCVAAAIGSPVAAAPAQEPTGLVTLVHAVRGLTADIYLDGSVVLETFQPERTTDPLPIPAGDHLVEVRSAGLAASSEPLLSAPLSVVARTQSSAVVHLDADGAPALTSFSEEVTPTPAGQGRVRVRNVAASGPIDVQIGGETVATGLANGTESGRDFAAGTYPVTASAGGQELLPPAELSVAAGSATAIYLIGAASDDSLAWLIQSIATGADAPQSISGGTDGLAAPAPFPTSSIAVLGGVAAVAMVARIRTRATCRAAER